MLLKRFVLTTLATVIAGSLSLAAAAAGPNKEAPQGGIMNYNFDAEPESLHPIMGGDLYNAYLRELAFDTMCTNSDQTWELKPRLAEKWDVSKDGLTFTFFLRKDAYFHNGENVTADDVKFSLDAVREPKHQALNLIPYFEKFTKAEVVDKYTIKFTASEPYFQNLTTLCTMTILPKSVYGNIEKSVKMQKDIVGSGPYKMEKYDKGQSIILKKFDKWYGDKTADWKGYFNFAQINIRFTREENIMLERLKKGELDFARMGVESFKKATGAPFGTKVFANKVENSEPKSYGFIGFNFKRDIFKDKDVRTAFAHLVNRELMNTKFFNGWNYLATSPTYVKGDFAPSNKPIEFNPKKAQELLKKAGWGDSDKNGILDKMINGKKVDFKVSLIYANKDSEKYWTIVKEDAKKAGIDLELRFLEWNSFVKNIDDKNFDMMAMGWGGGDVEDDPKQIWHSTSAGKGGSNYISYENKEVDKLIDQARGELDKEKRKQTFKKLYGVIADDVPYVFMFNKKFEFYGNSAKMKKSAETFKYNFGYRAWWAAEK
ncbi:MAG: peptide ABC transporter substrate-binding protein [Bdellovibrio sp.]|nr:peptide ABC transporter substrate-binding protein [Bdellovibrio sp.]